MNKAYTVLAALFFAQVYSSDNDWQRVMDVEFVTPGEFKQRITGPMDMIYPVPYSAEKFLSETYNLRLLEAWCTRTELWANKLIGNFSEQWYQNQKADHRFKKELLSLRVKGAQDVLKTIGNGVYETMGDGHRLLLLGGLIVGVFGGYYIVKRTVQIVADQVNKKLNTPRLLTETSWVNPLTRMKRFPAAILKKLFASAQPGIFSKIVVSEDIAQKLRTFAQSTAQVKSINASYQNVLLYGPAGTGKTLFATLLAHELGMDYAIMSGSCFDQFDDSQAIVQLNQLFDWAESSSKGVILFIDEAETFLGSRSHASLKSRQLLSAFLHRTGGQSNRYILVFATNRPDMLDKAVLDRCSLKIKFDVPQLPERIAMLKLHVAQQLTEGAAAQIDYEHIAHKMEGFSGRQIMQFVVGLRAHMLVQGVDIPSAESIERVLEESILYHQLDDLEAFA